MVALMIFKSLRQHRLATAITSVSIALAGGLLMTVWSIKSQATAAFAGSNAGFDAVLGARSSKLQLVLNCIFHLDESPGNISWDDYLAIAANPHVALAVPLAVGDNYRGYRLVGVSSNLFTEVEYAPGQRYRLAEGRIFEPARREAVVGSLVAQRLQLKPGDEFHPYHGLLSAEPEEHEEVYVVVGVLRPSNTPVDRVIWIPLAGIQHMGGHDPRAATDISGVLVKLKGTGGFLLDLKYNKQDTRLTFAWPIGRIVAQLFDKISWLDRVLVFIAYLVGLVAAGSVLASIYNSMNERRRDLAILRALGARRRLLFAAIVGEAAAIGGLGMILAGLVHVGLMILVAYLVRVQTGVALDPWAAHPSLWLVPIGMITLSALGGVVPALKAYQTPVAENLAPIS
jgi:putative ABC transport system permease protein